MPTSLYTAGDRLSSVGVTFSLDKRSTASRRDAAKIARHFSAVDHSSTH